MARKRRACFRAGYPGGLREAARKRRPRWMAATFRFRPEPYRTRLTGQLATSFSWISKSLTGLRRGVAARPLPLPTVLF